MIAMGLVPRVGGRRGGAASGRPRGGAPAIKRRERARAGDALQGGGLEATLSSHVASTLLQLLECCVGGCGAHGGALVPAEDGEHAARCSIGEAVLEGGVHEVAGLAV